MPGDADRILHAGIANIALGHLQRSGDPADGFQRGKAALLDRQVEVFTAAAGQIGRDLLDDEVLGGFLEEAAATGNISRQVRVHQASIPIWRRAS